jgi:hypothetical protein
MSDNLYKKKRKVSNFLRGENDTSFVIEGVGISDDVVLFLR